MVENKLFYNTPYLILARESVPSRRRLRSPYLLGRLLPQPLAYQSPFLQVPCPGPGTGLSATRAVKSVLQPKERGSRICPGLWAMVCGRPFGLVDRSSVHAGVVGKIFGEGNW